MTLRKLPEIKVDPKKWEDMEQLNMESFRTPSVPPKVVINLVDSRTTVNGLLAAGMFDLDADKQRQGDKARLFSPRDTLLLSVAAHYSQVGLPRPVSKAIAESFARYHENNLRDVRAFFSNLEIVAFRARVGATLGWEVIMQRRLQGQTKLAYVLRDGKWVKADQLKVEIPPVRVVLDVDEFLRRTMLACGIRVISGDRHAFARALKEMS